MGRRIEAPLPVWEQSIYWVVGVSGILFGIYNVYLASLDLKDKLEYVEDGAEILGRKQDVADYEWHIYSTYFCWKLPPILFIHVALSRAMFLFNVQTQTRKYVHVLLGCVWAWWLQSWRFLLLLCLTPLPFYLASSLATVPGVWAVCLAATYVCNTYADQLMYLMGISDSVNYFVIIYIWASVFLRCTCFSIERVWSLNQAKTVSKSEDSRKSARVARTGSHINEISKKKTSSSSHKQNGCTSDAQEQLYGWPVLPKVPGICDMYVYVFYTPSLFTGPPVTYKSFKEQIENPVPLSRDRLAGVIRGTLRVCFWFFFNNVMLHFLYFKAFGHNFRTMESVSKWTLTTAVYLNGQFMTNKYVVIFGCMHHTAALDGLDLAENPACISYVYTHSDLWKSFDRGLYDCLKRYIYIPLGGSRAGLLRRELAFLTTFLFVGYWHGGGERYITWALLNFAAVNVVTVGHFLERSSLVQELLIQRMSARGMRRLRCVLLYPVWLLSTVSNMYFLVGPEFAHIYASRICLQWDSFLTLGVVFYCIAQGAKQLEQLGCTRFS